ncbi:DUF6361 family protein [Variovorax boronicumulans]|uniref:DUF6361 family protein n=1 Tax=Variovorax boronicumulans TaxID=436515 RepID=UPI0036F4316E
MIPVSSKSTNTRARTLRSKAKQPAIGWVLISRAEVAKAEALLNDRQRGVVDELGLLSIHQAFADRLFPGTSVLHTRLRYALFVPWLMQGAAGNANASQKLAQLEFILTGRLKLGLKKKRPMRIRMTRASSGRVFTTRGSTPPSRRRSRTGRL